MKVNSTLPLTKNPPPASKDERFYDLFRTSLNALASQFENQHNSEGLYPDFYDGAAELERCKHIVERAWTLAGFAAAMFDKDESAIKAFNKHLSTAVREEKAERKNFISKVETYYMNAIPEYVAVSLHERGTSFNISFEDYRWLARTALSITSNLDATMGIYSEEGECMLDIFTEESQLTIKVNSLLGQISRHCIDLDAIEGPMCLFTASNSDEDWRLLGQTARNEVEI